MADVERFTERPEQLNQLDSSLFRTIAKCINAATANSLERTSNGSGTELLSVLHKKADTAGEAVGAAAELQLSKMREQGIGDMQVISLNDCIESYDMRNAAQSTASKVRAPTLVHQDPTSVFNSLAPPYRIPRTMHASSPGSWVLAFRII